MNVKRLFLVLVFLCVGFLLPAAAQTSKFTDPRDNKTYRTVVIGNKVWMAENLNHKIGNSWCYDNKDSNCSKYGRLYDWNTAARVACPRGWRLPSDADWDDVVLATGGEEVAGKKLKSKTGWDFICTSDMMINDEAGCIVGKKYSGNGTDDFGFSALPGGGFLTEGSFEGFAGVGGSGNWWSVSEIDVDNVSAWGMSLDYESMGNGWVNKSNGLSVRCLQD